MLDKVIENNRVCIIGEIVSEFTFSHEVFGDINSILPDLTQNIFYD